MDNQQISATPSKQNNRNRRTRNLVMVTSLSAVVLIASTYAWFTGLQSVKVEPFQVEISSADSLELSLNGEQWSDTLNLTKDNILNTGDLGTDKINQKAYKLNTNNWPINTKVGTSETATGLVPLSTIGAMNTTSSRMIMFEKSSMTTTDGGYRLLASTVDNDKLTGQKQKGYVAFDLFVKNYSGTQYLTNTANANDTSFEEAIYLNTDSKVEVSSNDSKKGIASTGIENSVRVAFAQIGRISAYANDVSSITSINCNNKTNTGTDNNTTGLCRKAQIWEPNDKEHKETAKKWYTKSCLKRTGATTYSTTECTVPTVDSDNNALENYLPTYAIGKPVEVTDPKVDIYDGAEYNGYTGSSSSYSTFMSSDTLTGPLVKFDYFTDTEKIKRGMERPTFMTLAPNSITKIRVYVYIEGQDIDNFDYAQVGKYITVAFGFSKQRYTADQITTNSSELYQNLPSAVK